MFGLWPTGKRLAFLSFTACGTVAYSSFVAFFNMDVPNERVPSSRKKSVNRISGAGALGIDGQSREKL